ncbi:MAG TPA: HAD family hydrolase [Thermoanaerobaculia bacterium]|jgi:phosphoglycolate phosphatase|nr:HAD family hydrolase [Thermoanaerobaculia bacterium]
MSGAVFLDLDGPLLDVSERYHRLHSDLVSQHGGRPLDRATYWRAKRERVPEAEILAPTGLSPEAVAAVEAARGRGIESPEYLILDRPWPWTLPTLAALAGLAPLVLVTLRRHPDRLLRQLGELDLHRYFDRVVSGPGDGTLEAKAWLLRSAGIPIPPESVLVGDTEIDIASGRALHLKTIAVRSGIRGDAHLARCAPDLLVDDLRQVLDHLQAGPGRRP